MSEFPSRHLAIALSLLFIIAALTVVAISDCHLRRVPNAVSVLILLSGCVFQFCASDWSGLRLGLQGFGVGFALALPLYLFAGLGGGDVKLLAAGGALFGPSLIVQAAAWAAVMGGMVALLAVIASPRRVMTFRRWCGGLRPTAAASVHTADGDPGKRRMPMAPAVAMGMLMVILQSADFARIFAIRDFLDLIRCSA